MRMSKMSVNIGFTVPPALADRFDRLSREEESTKSEMFRRILRFYLAHREPTKQGSSDPAAWAERLILKAQEEKSRNPLSPSEFLAGIEKAQRYGEQRAKALGIESEEQLNEMLYAERKAKRQAASRS